MEAYHAYRQTTANPISIVEFLRNRNALNFVALTAEEDRRLEDDNIILYGEIEEVQELIADPEDEDPV